MTDEEPPGITAEELARWSSRGHAPEGVYTGFLDEADAYLDKLAGNTCALGLVPAEEHLEALRFARQSFRLRLLGLDPEDQWVHVADVAHLRELIAREASRRGLIGPQKRMGA